jgi:hypothetical protein
MRRRLGCLLIALLSASILTMGTGMGANCYANQYVTAINGVPGWINIWPSSYSLEWQLYEGGNIYDSYPDAGPEDWYLSSNKDWHAEIYDANGWNGHFYDWSYGNQLMDPMGIEAYTYAANGSITLSNDHQNLWAGPPGDNLWLDTAYIQNVNAGEPEAYYQMALGTYAYTDY